jgi:hypothetical protein
MLFYVVALVLGIWLTVRKLDVSRREAADHPNVAASDFERWKSSARRAYTLGSVACFLKLFLDVALEYGAPRVGLPWRVSQIGGGLAFFAWIASLVTVWVMSARARRLEDQLGLKMLASGTHQDPIPASEEGPDALERKESGP